MPDKAISSFFTFGDLLKYLRRRAQLTQRELALAVGYTEGHVSRLEKNQRPPDLATVAALFVPALGLQEEPEIAAQLMRLAASARAHQELDHANLLLSHVRETTESSESAESIPTNLPIQLTTFIGREAQIRRLTELLSGENPSRLVTLIGPGGMGKTRLALQTTIGLLHLYQDGIWFVDLTPLSMPELIPQTIASTLRIPETTGQAIEEDLVAYLRLKHVLIVIDNCEHLILGAARLAQRILSSCAHVQILATSREHLNVPGEVNFRVPPLSLPESQHGASQSLLAPEAVQLFIERAHNAEALLTLNDADVSIIARICRQLDGMPLAIELAAARTSLLSPSQIESRLKDRFQLLTASHLTVPRHQTLRATLEWSHELISQPEQIFFRRLSVFAGGWTLEAASSVCAQDGNDVLDLLAGLVNKSLVLVERQPDGDMRYAMLETIREYAREQLLVAGEFEELRARHFNYFCTLLKEREPDLFVNHRSLDLAEREIDNIRTALVWTLERNPAGTLPQERAGRGLELMIHVWPLWLYRGYVSEGYEWMRQLLAIHTASTPARSRALLLAADFARYRGDYTGQAAFAEEALMLARNLGDKKRIAWSLMEMGLVERTFHRYSGAIPLLRESLEMFQELIENLWVCRTSFLLAETYLATANLELASPLLERGLELCRAENDQWQIAWGLEALGTLKMLSGDLNRTSELYTESLHLRIAVMDKVGITYSLQACAQLATAERQFERAAVLWGAAEQLRQTLSLLLDPLREKLHTSLIARARKELGEQRFAATWAQGRALKMQQAIDYAFQTHV